MKYVLIVFVFCVIVLNMTMYQEQRNYAKKSLTYHKMVKAVEDMKYYPHIMNTLALLALLWLYNII